MSAVSLANQIEHESVTSEGLDFFFGEDFTSFPDFDPFIINEKFVTLFMPTFAKPKKKLKGWGLFKGLKIEEKEIEEAKKSLFPEREF